ncbi:hypothetical protein AGMMS50230_23070 [Spirochaetia bacterium]|nr:hypothetical protein AGMMS50230_23070 [Spirochaetia bacterium]
MNLLYSNTNNRNLLKKLSIEEIFLMNLPDNVILSILNISIYEAIINKNYELLYNGIYTYSHLQNLNRQHLKGFDFTNFIECLIFNENEYIGIINWKEYVVKQFMENYKEQMNGKFDSELLEVLNKTISLENGIENNFNNLVKLHSKCQWLTKGLYRECNLINYMPIYLIGIYKFIDKKIKIETKNEYFIEFINYLDTNKKMENKLVYKFTGEIDFLNKILDKEYNNKIK